MAIEFVLAYKGTPRIRLTENVIQTIDLSAVKCNGFLMQTKNITMLLKFENANVYYREPSNPEYSEDGITMPDEIDSVRNMLSFALSTVKHGARIGLPFLDGVLSIANEHGEIARFSYENLFVVSFTEDYLKDTKNTFIKVQMREKAR